MIMITNCSLPVPSDSEAAEEPEARAPGLRAAAAQVAAAACTGSLRLQVSNRRPGSAVPGSAGAAGHLSAALRARRPAAAGRPGRPAALPQCWPPWRIESIESPANSY